MATTQCPSCGAHLEISVGLQKGGLTSTRTRSRRAVCAVETWLALSNMPYNALPLTAEELYGRYLYQAHREGWMIMSRRLFTFQLPKVGGRKVKHPEYWHADTWVFDHRDWKTQAVGGSEEQYAELDASVVPWVARLQVRVDSAGAEATALEREVLAALLEDPFSEPGMDWDGFASRPWPLFDEEGGQWFAEKKVTIFD